MNLEQRMSEWQAREDCRKFFLAGNHVNYDAVSRHRKSGRILEIAASIRENGTVPKLDPPARITEIGAAEVLLADRS